MCDSVIDTLRSIQGKTNDDLNTYQDLAEMSILDQLHLRSDGKKNILASNMPYFVKKWEDKFLSMYVVGESVTGILFNY